jgi:hypothetical protein
MLLNSLGGVLKPPRNAASNRRRASFSLYLSGSFAMAKNTEVSLDEWSLDLCMRMGVALSVWQDVETQHYHLFLTLLGIQEGEIPSVVYFGSENFDARRTMVSRMVHYFPTTKALRAEWNKIEKDLKDFSENRNKIAHYGIYRDLFEHTLPSGRKRLMLKPPSLQPSLWNRVSKLLGRTSDKKEHNLSADELNGYIRDFGALGLRIAQFNVDCARIQWPNGEVRKPLPPMIPVSPPIALNKL